MTNKYECPEDWDRDFYETKHECCCRCEDPRERLQRKVACLERDLYLANSAIEQEKKSRIKYQDYCYKILNILDKSLVYHVSSTEEHGGGNRRLWIGEIVEGVQMLADFYETNRGKV
jgi:hypothetical protein